MKFHSNYIMYLGFLVFLVTILMRIYLKQKSRMPSKEIDKWTGTGFLLSSILLFGTLIYQYVGTQKQLQKQREELKEHQSQTKQK